MGNPKAFSECAAQLRSHDRAHFMLCLFAPEAVREQFFAFFTLNVELEHVHHAVSEVMIGQIRYAWWEENLNAIAGGQPPRQHPVLQALGPEAAGQGLKLVDSYRAHYPELPPERDTLAEDLSHELVRALCPEVDPGWKRALQVLRTHRARHSGGAQGRLAFKLLWAGRR